MLCNVEEKINLEGEVKSMSKKLNVAVAIMLCLTFVLAIPIQTVQAKTTNKKSITLTMTEENPTCRCELFYAAKRNGENENKGTFFLN